MTFFALGLGAVLASSAAAGGPPPAPPHVSATQVVAACGEARRASSPCCCDRFRASLSLPIWVPGVSGTLATGSQEVNSSSKLLDRVLARETISELKFAFVGRVEASWQRWRFLADAYGATVGAGTEWKFLGTETETELQVVVGRAVVGYEVWRRPADRCARECASLAPYVGVRLWDVELAIEDESASRSWVDGLVGLEARWSPHPRWMFRLLADVGGGIDAGSRFTWSASAEAHYRFSRRFSMFLGYGVLDVHYDRGDGGDRFVVDVTIAGPQLGFTVDF